MKRTRAEIRMLAVVKPSIDRFDLVWDVIVKKIREDNLDGLEDDCWQAIPLLWDYKRALRKICRMADRREPDKRAEREEDRKLEFGVLDIVIMGGALRKSPSRIREILKGWGVEEILAPRGKHQNLTVQ